MKQPSGSYYYSTSSFEFSTTDIAFATPSPKTYTLRLTITLINGKVKTRNFNLVFYNSEGGVLTPLGSI